MAATWKKLAFDADKVSHSLATAANDFLVASGSGVYVKKTLAETQALITGMIKVVEVTLSADATKTISSSLVPGKRYKLVIEYIQNTTTGYPYLLFNNDTGAHYVASQLVATGAGHWNAGGTWSAFPLCFSATTAKIAYPVLAELIIFGTASGYYVAAHGSISVIDSGAAMQTLITACQYFGAADLSRIDLAVSAGTMTGKVVIYELI